MPAAMPACRSEVLSDVDRGYTAREEATLDARADELLTERLYEGDEHFPDLMCSGASSAIDRDLQRALRNLDAAINGDEISRTALLTALSNIQKTLKFEAESQWRDDCREEAEQELAEGAL